jgi:hypothetical protein
MVQGEIKEHIDALKGERVEGRQTAFEVLVKIGAQAVPLLIESLKDEDSDVRQVAASALVKIGEPAVPALIKLLKDGDESSDVHRIATWILTNIGGLAIPALVDAIRCQDEDVYETVTIADAELDEKTIEQNVEEVVPPRAKLQVEDLLSKAQPKDRLGRPHRMSIAPFSISELKVAPAQAQPGESVNISFKAVNNSDADNYYPVTLRINGVVVSAEVVSLPRRTTLPMIFTVVGTVPGGYNVEVNDAAGKFTVVEKEIKGKIREPMVPKPELSVSEVRSEVRGAAIETDSQRKKNLDVNVAQESGGLASAIDKVADYIEFGLDKMGDGIAFPFKKIVDASTTISKARDKKAKKRN